MSGARRLVTAIIKPFRTEAVIKALGELPVEGLTVSECRGYGRQKGHLELYTGPEYTISFLPKVLIEFTCSRFDLDAVLERLTLVAKTGRIGDGKVFVMALADPPTAPR